MTAKSVTLFFIKLILLVQNLALIYSISAYKWWWFVGIGKFSEWYNNYGVLLWFFRIMVVVISFSLTIYFLRKELKSYPIFIPYVILAFLLQNQHPFSNMAVYTSFPSKSYYYYIENEKGKVSNHGLNYDVNDIIDIYAGYVNRNNLFLETDTFPEKEVGKEIFDYVKKQNARLPSGCFKVVQIKSFFEKKKIVSTKTIFYEECIE